MRAILDRLSLCCRDAQNASGPGVLPKNKEEAHDFILKAALCILVDQYARYPPHSKEQKEILADGTAELLKIFVDHSLDYSPTRVAAINQSIKADRSFEVWNDRHKWAPLGILRRWVTKTAGRCNPESGKGLAAWVQRDLDKTTYLNLFDVTKKSAAHILYAKNEGKDIVDAAVQGAWDEWDAANPDASAKAKKDAHLGLRQKVRSQKFKELPAAEWQKYKKVVADPNYKPPP